jgi:hypothetical protein
MRMMQQDVKSPAFNAFASEVMKTKGYPTKTIQEYKLYFLIIYLHKILFPIIYLHKILLGVDNQLECRRWILGAKNV